MQRQIIRTPLAPAAIGPYSQAVSVVVGDKTMVFCSGQIALDPQTGVMSDGDVADQARIVLDNLGNVLAAAGASYANVVKTTIFLADMNDFAVVNAIYAARFPTDPPARATVAAAGLPRGARVEIDAIAIV
ncbi:MAG: Rid family detoxifying hydrolase [Kofleriaceae bacterium]